MATALMLIGTAVSAVGTIATGQAQSRAAEYSAKVEDLNAKNERASAQREAMEYRRKAKLVHSTLQNNAASSGFSATDAGALKLTGDIAQQGEYQAELAQYGGDNRAEGLKAAAVADRARGQAAVQGSYLSAAGTLIGGFSNTLYDKYGFGAPSAGATKGNYGAFGNLFGYG